jgi:hypothetical protein
LLANIALNSFDGQLHDAGYRFVCYADDFVVLCRTEVQVQEAHDLVQRHLTSLGLTLSAEKTKTTKFRDGFAFLCFAISAWSVTMRPKSVEKFKAKVRALTPRHHNLDATVIRKLNSVIRGTANYFATSFSDVGDRFRGLDRWILLIAARESAIFAAKSEPGDGLPAARSPGRGDVGQEVPDQDTRPGRQTGLGLRGAASWSEPAARGGHDRTCR